ncbi:lysophospholipase [Jannaschia pagri]|uniref:Lysophospholipase n=1 Tax=Jannaschia pagri TaxID=2829797 RepID=A0ABQ4NN41_9RHOB|nr:MULTISPECIES: alpha/beta hydrolase [unclassified Jannaschia]GIT91942.1 lysophospholipase [Jannaschia sp. AI_61]GIT95776.1 lysophospholipase [Jannaschia sp. AI_62]
MARVLRMMLLLVVGLAVAIGALWIVGPYETVETEISFDGTTVPEDLDGWLADTEAQVPNLRPASAKRIRWAGPPGQRTDLAIVYLHGFSADPWEIRPVPDRVAEALGANLFFQRLSGHGRDGAAMAEPSAGDWLEDLAEAMEIGRRLGDRVLLMATSTGGTLAALAAADPALAPVRADLDGVILVSPNFKVASPAARLLSWPAARHWVPLLAGETRSFEPQNTRHAAHWTVEYPTVSVLPMQALVDYAATMDWSAATVPALIYVSPDDSVVDPTTTERVAAAWGGPMTVERVTLVEGDDSYNHVLAGDILSPAQTPEAIDRFVAWIKGL